MAEYYPLLAKAVASLPNSTPDSRKIVYERARKALIGQLRTLHPPVPDDDIERESVALDRAVERLESELAAPPAVPETPPATPIETPTPPKAAPSKPTPLKPNPLKPRPAKTDAAAPRFPATGGGLGPSDSKPIPPLRTKLPPPKPASKVVPNGAAPVAAISPAPATAPAAAIDAGPTIVPIAESQPGTERPPGSERPIPPSPVVEPAVLPPADETVVARDVPSAEAIKPRPEPQRPFAPQPPEPKGPKRPLWIIPSSVIAVMLLVGLAAYKLRDHPETLVRAKPTDQQTTDASKIVERVGGAGTQADTGTQTATDSASGQAKQPAAPANPALPVAGRAAMLVEAPNEPNKIKTYLGTVVWRLDNVSDGQNQAVGLAVRADVDLPEDKLKASVVFQKNFDASLPASHTMKVRFIVQPNSPTGNIKEINVLQMRREDSATGEALDGVTVPIVENSFLIGLTPGNSETANLEMLRGREWIDIPIRLSSGKIAKLTFEKTAAGQRDLQEAIVAWAKP